MIETWIQKGLKGTDKLKEEENREEKAETEDDKSEEDRVRERWNCSIKETTKRNWEETITNRCRNKPIRRELGINYP